MVRIPGVTMSCDMCTDPDGAPCFPLYGIGPHIHHPGGGTTLLPGAQMAGYTPNLEEPGYGTHWCPHCGDGKPEGAAPTTPILKDLNLELLETATPAGVPAAAPDARDGWVSVSERLPEIHEWSVGSVAGISDPVLTCDENEPDSLKVQCLRKGGSGDLDTLYWDYDDYTPTHWMKAPAIAAQAGKGDAA